MLILVAPIRWPQCDQIVQKRLFGGVDGPPDRPLAIRGRTTGRPAISLVVCGTRPPQRQWRAYSPGESDPKRKFNSLRFSDAK